MERDEYIRYNVDYKEVSEMYKEKDKIQVWTRIIEIKVYVLSPIPCCKQVCSCLLC